MAKKRKKYKSLFGTGLAPTKKSSKKKKASKYKSVIGTKKEKISTQQKKTRERQQSQKLIDRLVNNKYDNKVPILSKKEYQDKILTKNIKAEKGFGKNTASLISDNESFRAQQLDSTWLAEGQIELSNNGKMELTIEIIKVMANRGFKKYHYTYQVMDVKVWEEMKAADSPGGGGAGTVFHKYHPRYIKRIKSIPSGTKNR